MLFIIIIIIIIIVIIIITIIIIIIIIVDNRDYEQHSGCGSKLVQSFCDSRCSFFIFSNKTMQVSVNVNNILLIIVIIIVLFITTKNTKLIIVLISKNDTESRYFCS